jgi:hypothetical protein
VAIVRVAARCSDRASLMRAWCSSAPTAATGSSCQLPKAPSSRPVCVYACVRVCAHVCVIVHVLLGAPAMNITLKKGTHVCGYCLVLKPLSSHWKKGTHVCDRVSIAWYFSHYLHTGRRVHMCVIVYGLIGTSVALQP